jgi:hypothetical protein
MFMRYLTEPRVAGERVEYKKEEINQKLTFQDYLLLQDRTGLPI